MAIMLYKFANGFLIICTLILTISLLIPVNLIPLSFTVAQNTFKDVNAFIKKEIALSQQANTNEAINHYDEALSINAINTRFFPMIQRMTSRTQKNSPR
jgi:hypothetical protein